ncbi:MAG: glycosyltransferase family 4 protein, partial [Nitrospira sp.]|nr:glycosyltransferase family 4 protein [Nitrospira sp.]
MAETIKNNGFAYFQLIREVQRNPHPLRIYHLLKLCKREKIDILQDFDTEASAETSFIQLISSVKSAHTYVGLHIPTYRLPRIGIPITIRQSFLSYLVNECGWPQDKVLFMPGRIDYHYLRNNCSEPKEQQRVLWMGRIDKVKGEAVSHLLKAWPAVQSTYPDSRLLIAGTGPLLEGFRKQVRKMNLNVDFLGATKAEDALSQANIVVGIERVVIEGLTVGKPAILLDSRGYGELVTPDKLDRMVLSNFNPDFVLSTVDLIKILNELIGNTGLQHHLGKAGWIWCDKNMDPRDSVKRLEAAYRDELSNRKNRIAGYLEWTGYIFSYAKFIIRRRRQYLF